MGDRSLLQTGVNEKRVSRIAAYATPSPPFSLPFPFGRACSCEISVAPDSHSCSCCVALLLRVSALRGHVSLVPELPNAFSTMPAHNSQTLRILNLSQLVVVRPRSISSQSFVVKQVLVEHLGKLSPRQ